MMTNQEALRICNGETTFKRRLLGWIAVASWHVCASTTVAVAYLIAFKYVSETITSMR